MKRAFTIMLVTVVLLLSLSVPVGAETEDVVATPYRKSVLLWNADESWGDVFELDTQNQVEGQGCVSMYLHASQGAHHAQHSLTPVDATSMDTLEFDLYLYETTDLGRLSQQGALVIASEKGAICLDMRVLRYVIESHDLVNGWNHIAIPLDPLAVYLGEFDASCINQISIHWRSTANFGKRSVIKFDHFMLTDREAVAQEDPTVKQTLGAYTDLLAQIKENYVACMMLPRGIDMFESDVDVAPLREQCMKNINSYSNLPDKDKELLGAKGYLIILRESRFRAEDYIDGKETLMSVSDVVSQILSLREYVDEGTLTPTNFQDVCERTAQVRTMYEGLTRKAKSELDGRGYLDILEAVEAASQMHAHDFVLAVMSGEYLASVATCTSGALYYYCCARCGEKGTETFEIGDPKGHNPTEDYKACGVEGHAIKCEDCSKRIGDVIPHTLSEWRVTREATPTENGQRVRDCSGCFYSEREEFVYVVSGEPNESDRSEVPDQTQAPDAATSGGCFAHLSSGAWLCFAILMLASLTLQKKK
jgi:hypothetical protein